MNSFHKDILTRSIFLALDSIENKTNIMAHHNPVINDKLKDWQDGKLPDVYFKEFLNKYIDQLNGEN